MAIRKQDENGNYRLYDVKSQQFIDEEPLASSMGQIEHQTSLSVTGKIIDQDENIPVEIDSETGMAVIGEDEAKIKAFIKEAISIDNFIETFNDNSHETLLKLLALQDNKHPLKKGGVGIAYRTDALIMHCKMELSAEENVVFDAILGTMSSFPENKSYRIAPTDFVKFSKYDNVQTLYRTFRSGTKKLKDRNLVFDELGPDGKDDIEVPWFNVLRYHNATKDENAFIEFAPSDFFKDLALCSQIVHGAYGALEVTTQLRGKYTIALYWFLENKKNYKTYPSAVPGIFEMSMEELKHQFSIPQSYGKTDMERRVLEPAKVSINNVGECDFTFDYESLKANGSVAGYRFIIKNKNYIDVKPEDVKVIDVDPFEEQIKMLIGMTGLTFDDNEISSIYKCAKRNNRDAAFMMQVISAFKSRLDNSELESIDDNVAYLCAMVENGTSAKINANKTEKKTNQFNNFSQREMNFDELEQKMLNKTN